MIKIIAALTIAATITGCANLTPEQNAALGAGLVGAAAVAGAVANARQPVYYVRPAPVRVCNVYGRCWLQY
jgi:hypothetical protein